MSGYDYITVECTTHASERCCTFTITTYCGCEDEFSKYERHDDGSYIVPNGMFPWSKEKA